MEPVDGSFTIQADILGVFLVVVAPSEGGKPVEAGQVLDALLERKIEDVNRSAIDEAIKMMSGSPVKITDAKKKAPPAEIGVIVSRDRMEAFLQIDLPEGAVKPDMDMIMEHIDKSGIMFGLMEEAIALALRQPSLRVLCAKGLAPESGADAKLEYRISLENKGKPVELADGSVDFKNLGMYVNVAKGQVLAEKIPATPGIPGSDVFGSTVPSKPGKDLVLHPGPNVEIVNEKQMVAAVAGNLLVVAGKMSVSPILQIKGDVDLSTGNIDFAGDVVIQGSVTEGFSVKAGGNVEVAGMVSGASIQGVNITVRMGIHGLNKGVITSSGIVVAKFIENATVTAEQEIVVTDVVMHSHLSAGKKIRVEGQRGLIVGGVAAAGDEIIVKSAGSSSTTPTELHAGVNPKLRDEFFRLRKDLKVAEDSLDQLKKGLVTLRSIDPNLLPPEKKELLLKITKAQYSTMGQVETMRKRLTEVEAAYEDLKGGQIKISDYVHPGVKIVIGALIKPIQETSRFLVYYMDAGEIRFRPLK